MSTPAPRISLVWAQARGRVIGTGTAMPWHLPADLAFFKSETLGRPVVMGRATWESIPERFRPLPGRRNIVLSRDPGFVPEGGERAGSVDEALALAGDDCAVIGGGRVYAATLDRATECVVTEIDADAPGDVLAPELGADWTPVEAGDWATDPRSRVESWDAPVRHRFTRWRRAGV